MHRRRLVLPSLIGAGALAAGLALAPGPTAGPEQAAAAARQGVARTAEGIDTAWKPSPAWKRVARQLEMPVYEPSQTFGLELAWVNRIVADPGCVNDGRDQLRAFYGSQAGRYFELSEGHPRYCYDGPIRAPILRHVTIRGQRVPLHDANGRLALEWCERGTTITFVSAGLPASRLIAIARSVKPVDRAPAKRCPS